MDELFTISYTNPFHGQGSGNLTAHNKASEPLLLNLFPNSTEEIVTKGRAATLRGVGNLDDLNMYSGPLVGGNILNVDWRIEYSEGFLRFSCDQSSPVTLHIEVGTFDNRWEKQETRSIVNPGQTEIFRVDEYSLLSFRVVGHAYRGGGLIITPEEL